MRVEHSKLSLAGNRPENQDRVDVIAHDDAVLLIVVDGMGGHAHGARAAEVTVATLKECFAESPDAGIRSAGLLDALARSRPRPRRASSARTSRSTTSRARRAPCASSKTGAPTGRTSATAACTSCERRTIRERTRDHSHVELLLREGLIHEHELRGHPMRNFVECCLGGDAPLPDMSVTGRKKLSPGDVLLVCTDGAWSGRRRRGHRVARAAHDDESLERALRSLAERAVARNSPYSDNTSAAAVRWHRRLAKRRRCGRAFASC